MNGYKAIIVVVGMALEVVAVVPDAIAVRSFLLPHLISGDMDAQMNSVLFSVSLVVVILAVTPWDYVWKRYVSAAGEPWR